MYVYVYVCMLTELVYWNGHRVMIKNPVTNRSLCFPNWKCSLTSAYIRNPTHSYHNVADTHWSRPST